jgi:hypothetical protein
MFKDIQFATRPSPRGGLLLGEDFVAATAHAVVVLDGVSVPAGMEIGCAHGTPWYVQQLGTRLLVKVGTESQDRTPLADLLAESIAEVSALHADTCDLTHPGTPASTVAILRSFGLVEYLVLSDSAVILETLQGLQVIQDSRVDATAVELAEVVLATATSDVTHAERRRAMIAERRAARNVPGGYWIASTDPEAAAHAVTGRVRHIRRAAVLTDGATRLHDFGLATWGELLDTLDLHGPAEVIRQVRAAEDEDPTCTKWPRTKTYDDATAAFCRFI